MFFPFIVCFYKPIGFAQRCVFASSQEVFLIRYLNIFLAKAQGHQEINASHLRVFASSREDLSREDVRANAPGVDFWLSGFMVFSLSRGVAKKTG
jgi:hypothetical protein